MLRLSLLWVAAWFIGAAAAPTIEAAGLPAPDLVLVILCAGAVARGPRWGCWTGLVVGLLVDVVALGRPGPVAPSYVWAGWVAGYTGRILVARTRGLVAASLLAAAAAETTLWAVAPVAGFTAVLSWTAVGRILLTGLLAPGAAALDRPPEAE